MFAWQISVPGHDALCVHLLAHCITLSIIFRRKLVSMVSVNIIEENFQKADSKFARLQLVRKLDINRSIVNIKFQGCFQCIWSKKKSHSKRPTCTWTYKESWFEWFIDTFARNIAWQNNFCAFYYIYMSDEKVKKKSVLALTIQMAKSNCWAICAVSFCEICFT